MCCDAMMIVDRIFIPLGSCCEREGDWPEVDRIYSRRHHLGTMIMMRISMRVIIAIMREDHFSVGRGKVRG